MINGRLLLPSLGALNQNSMSETALEQLMHIVQLQIGGINAAPLRRSGRTGRSGCGDDFYRVK